jgi:hypothetical protein
MKTKRSGHISGGCRSKIAKNDTVNTPRPEGNDIPWPHEDCIRWVEWRIRELTIESGEYVDERGKWLLEEKAAGGRKIVPGDKVADYAVWLLKERDSLSWHQIAYRCFPTATEEDIETYESRVRRIHGRVERNHPGSKNFKSPRFSEYDKFTVEAIMLGAFPVYISDSTSSAKTTGSKNIVARQRRE